jgi:hypothetical protein
MIQPKKEEIPMKRGLVMLLVLISVVSGLFATVLVEDFRNVRSFEYKVTTPEGEFYYGANIVKTGNSYELTTYGRQTLSGTEEITLEQIFSTTYGNWFMLFLNPIFNAALEMVDINNPTALNYFGMQLKYDGMETVGKWTGKKFTLYAGGGPMMSWVINEQLQMSIKTVYYEENLTMELISFSK